jgi:hypothetical protein
LGPPSAADTTIDANIITLNDGEGVSIPESDFDPASEPAAANTTLTDNIFDGNRTDICNESDSTTIGAGNVGAGNGAPTISDDCMVEPGGF